MTVRLCQAVTLPPMQYGAPTRFTHDGSDRRLVTTINIPNGSNHPRLAATDSTLSGPWEAIAGATRTYHCAPGPGPLGCGETYFISIDQDSPATSRQLQDANPGSWPRVRAPV